MPALDNAASRFFEDLNDVLQEQYWPRFEEQVFRKGSDTNKIIPFAKDGEFEVEGDGINIQVMTGNADTARVSNDVHSDFPTPRTFQASKIKVRFSESSPSANDFAVFNTAAKVTHPETMAKGAGAIIDVAKRVFRDVTGDYDGKLAMFRNLDRTGRIALVNGTPAQNDSDVFADATASATNSTGVRLKIDNGPIAMLDQPGLHLDVWDPTAGAYSAQNIQVTDANVDPSDVSFGAQFNSTGDDQSSGDLADIADNDEIYLSGGKGFGMHSIESWFNRPASGDSFIGGLDRNTAANRWLLPISIRAGASTTVQVQPSHFTDLGDAMKFRTDETMSNVVAYGDTRLVSGLFSRLDPNSVIKFDPYKETKNREFTFGAMGVGFQHPTFGMISLMSNSLAKPGTMRLMVPSDWRSLYWGWRRLEFMSGDAGIAPWFRPTSDSGTGKAKVYKLEAYSMLADVCLVPSRQGQILNVSA